MDPSPSLQRRRVPAGRPAAGKSILEAAERLLLERGVDGFSIRGVSSRSGFSAPTIYHHFGDRSGLIHAVLEERFGELLEVMRGVVPGPDPFDYLREMARAIVRFALANPDHYRLLSTPGAAAAQLPSEEAARELVRRALEDLARQGRLASADVESAYQLTWATLHGLISLRILRPDYPFRPDLVELALETLERGLGITGMRS